MISKGYLVQSQRWFDDSGRQYPGDIYLVISDPWKCSDQTTLLVDVLGVHGRDTAYVEDLEVISKG